LPTPNERKFEAISEFVSAIVVDKLADKRRAKHALILNYSLDGGHQNFARHAKFHFSSGLRHDDASLVEHSERKFAAIGTILAKFIVRGMLQSMDEFQPPSVLRA